MIKKNELIAYELQQLSAQHHGLLQPIVIVEAARDPMSPLHDCFTWEDGVAAERWRLHEARQLIRVTATYIETKSKNLIPTRVFVSLSDDRKVKDGGYRSVVTVLSDAALRAQMLVDALAELQRFRAKYARLVELAEVFEAIDGLNEPETSTSSTEVHI